MMAKWQENVMIRRANEEEQRGRLNRIKQPGQKTKTKVSD
jgi:hypothetical protein